MPAPFFPVFGDARDTTGAVQTAYRLYFYRESDDGNTKAVYTTEDATTAHDQSTGIAPDSNGRWPPIWMDTDEPYYVQLWDDDRATTGTKLDEFDGYRPTVTVESNNDPGKNLLYNPGFSVAQYGAGPFTSATTPANSDDTYLLDQWILLSDGNDVVDVNQESTITPPNSIYSCKMEVETANKQFALVQILPFDDLEGLIDQSLTFSFYARFGDSNTTISTVRAALLAWTGTADSVTSDVVGTWAGAGTDPTLASSWAYENTPSDLTLTSAWQRFSITATLDTASVKNLAVIIWLDDTDATVNDILYVGACQLEVGSSATGYAARDWASELEACKYFFERIGGNDNNEHMGSGTAASTSAADFFLPFHKKRTVPSMSASSGTFGIREGGTVTQVDSGTEAFTFNNIGDKSARFRISSVTGSPLTAKSAVLVQASGDSSAIIDVNARL